MPRENFGGAWTADKLDRIESYLQAYVTALKRQNFTLTYMDAFAGSGYVSPRSRDVGSPDSLFYFLEPEMEDVMKGSALRALETAPPFDEYVFIEQNEGRLDRLRRTIERRKTALMPRIRFRCDDANQAIRNICRDRNYWRGRRAVLFLDPYAMEVDWQTLEAVAATQKIDMWYLFPVGALLRLLRTTEMPPPAEAAHITRLLGTEEWGTAFYRPSPQGLLFETDEEPVERNADLRRVFEFVRERMATIFRGGVSARMYPLENSRNACMFLLMFAVSNPAPPASRLAHDIADCILDPERAARRNSRRTENH